MKFKILKAGKIKVHKTQPGNFKIEKVRTFETVKFKIDGIQTSEGGKKYN